MSKSTKFEKMLNYLINENREKAEELFHDIIIDKSRKIYESLLDSDYTLDEVEDPEAVGGDPSDDFEDDVSGDLSADDEMDFETGMGDEMGDLEGEEEGLEDRVMDLEDAINDLKAEFEQLLADEADEPEHSDMDFDNEESEEWDEEGSDEDWEAPESDEEEWEDEDDTEEKMEGVFGNDSEVNVDVDQSDDDENVDENWERNRRSRFESRTQKNKKLREYVDKVPTPDMTSDKAQNKRSVVAGKNDMGGTANNIAQVRNGEGKQLPKTAENMNTGNVNVPGAKKATTLKSVSAKAASSEQGSVNKKSTLKPRS